MAAETIFGPDLSLTPSQQQLLRTTLASNRSPSDYSTNRPYPTPGTSPKRPQTSRTSSKSKKNQNSSPSNPNNNMFDSPIQQTPGSGNLGSAGFDESPFLEFEDDGNFDWDTNGDLMFGSLPGEEIHDDNEQHPKRKNSEDDEEEGEGDNKRHEGNEKSVKKPGRKPLNSSEPTTKRKAQNRAAQRAFRERKERHLKELESKVEDLEKASEHTNHENGRLRGQVERLNIELKEYRKRLSLGVAAASRSPQSATLPQPRNTFNNNSNDFQFAFPKFGDLPGSNFMTNGSLAKVGSLVNGDKRSSYPNIPSVTRGESSGSLNAMSPTSQHGSNSGSMYQSPTAASNVNGFEELNGLFSPSILETASRSNSTDYMSFNNGAPSVNGGKQRSIDSSNGQGQKANRTGSATSITASPASTMSHTGGLDSSCGTTPEASVESPDNLKSNEGTLNTINEENSFLSTLSGKTKFCKEWVKACGNIIDPVPRMMSDSDDASAPSSMMKSPVSDTNGIDWMAQQNGGLFDPVLFGDYRDPQDNILNNGFFNDAFLLQDDFGTAFNTGPVAAASPAPKRDLMKEVEVQQNGGADEEVVPGEATRKFIECDKLWDRMAAHGKVQSGEVDMNDLCAQLKQKAKCSGTGAVLAQKDVDDILGPAPEHQKDFPERFT